MLLVASCGGGGGGGGATGGGAAASTPGTARHSLKMRLASWRRTPVFYPLIGFIIVFIAMAVINDNFLTGSNLTNLARQTSIIAIIAVGMSLAILTGGIDLSVGSSIALVSVVGAQLIQRGWGTVPTVMAMILSGGFLGLLNGAAIAGLRMTPFMALALGSYHWMSTTMYCQPCDARVLAMASALALTSASLMGSSVAPKSTVLAAICFTPPPEPMAW